MFIVQLNRLPAKAVFLSCLIATPTVRMFFNIELIDIPLYIPEMNPIEQIWKEIRRVGFKVVDRLCDTICSLSKNAIKSIIGRDWILYRF